MRSTERRDQIIAFLSAERRLGVDELASRLRVTPSTIRRDLTRLTEDGAITRTFGGAVVTGATAPESPLHRRAQQARGEKDAIGYWAASQVGEGETVMLDAGTTVGRTAHHLRRRSSLTVITNGLTSIIELADANDIEVVVLGGTLRHISHGFVGPLTDMNLKRLTADRAFLGADGLTADRGICEASAIQTHAKELMAARANRVYVLADSSKIGHRPFNAWAPLEGPWTLVTDAGATESQLAPFRELDRVEVVVVTPGPHSVAEPREDRMIA